MLTKGILLKKTLLTFLISSVFLGKLIFSQNPYDSRNMSIPINASEIDSIGNLQASNPGEKPIRLHFNIGLLEKVTGFVFTQGRIETVLDSTSNYMGIEPRSFSKPSQSLYKIPIGILAAPFREAIKDDPEALSLVNRYRLLKTTTALLLTTAAFSGFMTVAGVLGKEYNFGNTRDGHIIFGTGLTFGFVGIAIIPTLFNRGKIQKAAKVYNRNKR